MEIPSTRNSKLHTSKPVRHLLLALGWIFVGLGALGALLPLLPTTPFILLAAYCFARGSDKAHAWLHQNRVFGPLLRDWENGGAISLRTKFIAAAMLLSLVGYQVFFGDRPIGLRIFLGVMAIGVLTFIFSRPSRPGRGSAS